MAAQGYWSNKMKIRQFWSWMPGTIRDWYAQLPKSTRHNWKLLSTKFKMLYCRTTGSYADRYFTMKMRFSETALQFFYRLNAAAMKAEIPFQTSSKRCQLHVCRFIKKLKDVQLKTALECHRFQSISEVERVPRRHESVWREDGYETLPTKPRDARADILTPGSLKIRRTGHAFLTQNVDAGTIPVTEKHFQCQTSGPDTQSLAAGPETPEYGPDDYGLQMAEMADETYEAYRVSEWSEQQRLENRNTLCQKYMKWSHPPIKLLARHTFKTVKHLASQDMLSDAVPSYSLAQLQTKDTGQGKQQLNH
ncbi:hypothetical protein PHMEG_0009794 [Phytophthora megakarya]|uniref:Retrotransposon gag domain-containing protein n=1 Tax=Phytophthora megakarya TaxID=4795 RepID=A0A225WFB9_9STRA|nr:hypothetical protein PHMEG_0009794 [Phytophthora megakarya]